MTDLVDNLMEVNSIRLRAKLMRAITQHRKDLTPVEAACVINTATRRKHTFTLDDLVNMAYLVELEVSFETIKR